MALLEIVTRPPMRELYRSRKQYPDGQPCYFRVRPTGTTHKFRLNVRVMGIRKQPIPPWLEITLEETDSGRQLMLSGGVSASNPRTGNLDTLCSPEDIRLSWCGLDPSTVRLLKVQDIHDIGDLKLYSERGLCAKLLSPGITTLTDQVAGEAVARFLRLRERLKQLGFHNPYDNDSELEPPTARELSASLFSD